MKVVILCGGMGTRMKAETDLRPKPMVEIGGHPILWHIMQVYAHFGYKSFILCLGYKGNMIREYFLNYHYMNHDIRVHLDGEARVEVLNDDDVEGWDVTMVDTGPQTMTGGRIARIEPYIDGDDFLMTYGDGLADVNIRALVDFHRRQGKIATVTGLHPSSRFGILETDDDGMVTRFREKPQMDGMISGGFFVFNRAVFEYLGDDTCVLEQEPMRMLAQNGEMAVMRHDGFWKSMDTYRDVQEFNGLWEKGVTPWKVW